MAVFVHCFTSGSFTHCFKAQIAVCNPWFDNCLAWLRCLKGLGSIFSKLSTADSRTHALAFL